MSQPNHTARPPYVHPDDPAGWLKPDEPFMVDGLDWSWAFVYYKEIPGYVGYCVGSNGTFWDRGKRWGNPGGRGTHRALCEWVRKSGTPDLKGYLHVSLTSPAGKTRKPRIHRLVLEAFVGPCPPGLEGCHKDGNPQNNAITNLRWDTGESNMADRSRHGRTHRATGELNSKAKIKESDVPRIFELYRSGMLQREIAGLYGVNQVSISNVLIRKTWSHVAV